MKPIHIVLLVIVISILLTITIYSCSYESKDLNDTENVMSYNSKASEVEIMQLINEYRLNLNLNALEQVSHISYKSEEHNNYMIDNNVVNHDNFTSRCENLISVLNAKRVGENIAYNYKTPKTALEAWLNSPSHKKNIVGDYTHFGIAITKNKENKSYYTNIFVKIE